MLTLNCTPAAIELNDPTGAMRRDGVDFTKLPLSEAWQWVNVNREVCLGLTGDRLLVRQHSATDCFGPRVLSHPITTNPDRRLSHARTLAELLGN